MSTNSVDLLSPLFPVSDTVIDSVPSILTSDAISNNTNLCDSATDNGYICKKLLTNIFEIVSNELKNSDIPTDRYSKIFEKYDIERLKQLNEMLECYKNKSRIEELEKKKQNEIITTISNVFTDSIFPVNANINGKDSTPARRKRYTIYPIEHQDLYDLYMKAQASYWPSTEIIEYQTDKKNFPSLDPKEQHYIKMILAFFSSFDGLVNENIVKNFFEETQIMEAKIFYTFQIAIESVHGVVYADLLQAYIVDEKEKDFLFNSVHTIPSISKKADWVIRWLDDKNTTYAERLLAFACIEGINFSSSFAGIFWVDHVKSGLLPALKRSNESISGDEGLHVDFAALMFRKFGKNVMTKERVLEIIRESVNLEIDFVRESLPTNLLGMNADIMIVYVKHVANQLLIKLGYTKYYDVSNPLPWMEKIDLMSKTNRFEKRNSQYQVPNVINKTNIDLNTLNGINCDF